MQIVNINEHLAVCAKCNSSIGLGNFTYIRDYTQKPRMKQELCTCNNCDIEFILQYDFFDSDDHINPFIFGGDVNDPTYNWQDQLTEDQQKEIGAHLSGCKKCSERLTHEMSIEAWLASLIHSKKK